MAALNIAYGRVRRSVLRGGKRRAKGVREVSPSMDSALTRSGSWARARACRDNESAGSGRVRGDGDALVAGEVDVAPAALEGRDGEGVGPLVNGTSDVCTGDRRAGLTWMAGSRMNGSDMPVAGLYLVTALCSTSAVPVSIRRTEHALESIGMGDGIRTRRTHVDVPGAVRLHPVRVAPALAKVLDGLLREQVGVWGIRPRRNLQVRRRDTPELPAGERREVQVFAVYSACIVVLREWKSTVGFCYTPGDRAIPSAAYCDVMNKAVIR